jgi:hypothetical protein
MPMRSFFVTYVKQHIRGFKHFPDVVCVQVIASKSLSESGIHSDSIRYVLTTLDCYTYIYFNSIMVSIRLLRLVDCLIPESV